MTVEAVGLLLIALGMVLAMLVFAVWNKADTLQYGNVQLWWDNRWRHGWRMPEGVTVLEYGKAVDEVCKVIGMEARVNGIVYGEETISPALTVSRTAVRCGDLDG